MQLTITAKNAERRSEVFEILSVCLQEVIVAAEAFQDSDQKITQLEKLARITTVNESLPDVQMNLATAYFHNGTTKLQNGDYKKCLSRMRDCSVPTD